jgi:hypothetical protein
MGDIEIRRAKVTHTLELRPTQDPTGSLVSAMGQEG